jgi:hypothetical protein
MHIGLAWPNTVNRSNWDPPSQWITPSGAPCLNGRRAFLKTGATRHALPFTHLTNMCWILLVLAIDCLQTPLCQAGNK